MTILKNLSYWERVAWLELMAVLLTLATCPWLLFACGPERAISGFAWLSLIAIPSLLSRFKIRSMPPLDERDEMISNRSQRISFSIFWVTFVLGVVFFGHILISQAAVHGCYLLLLPCIGATLLIGSRAVVTLTEYAKGRNDFAS